MNDQVVIVIGFWVETVFIALAAAALIAGNARGSGARDAAEPNRGVAAGVRRPVRRRPSR